MGEHDGVDVFRPADGQGTAVHFDDGNGKMYQYAESQQYFQSQQGAERRSKRLAQNIGIAVEHHDQPRQKQDGHHRRHHAYRAVRHCPLHFAPRLARHAFGVHDRQYQHFKKYSAHKGNRAIKMNDVGHSVDTHNERRLSVDSIKLIRGIMA